jgi:hypothetical protein
MSFDFYDDWEEDESDGLLGWGNDNFDRFLGSSSNYGATSQPGRQRAMSYGTRNRAGKYDRGRKKSAVQPHDGGPDPTIIPSSSYFGFLGRLPFKIGGKVLRYKPSAADLVEHPGQGRRSMEEQEPLIEESEEDALGSEGKGHRRQRSQTNSSGHTTDSLSSRGDIFPSEDELDDAVPLDDEFTIALERRTTGQGHDDQRNGKTPRPSSNRPAGSRVSTRTTSSRGTQDSGRRSNEDGQMKRSTSVTIEEMPTMTDLKQEEERVRLEEEREIERRRQDAQRLALQRGLIAEQRLSARTPSPGRSRPPQPPASAQSATAAVRSATPILHSPTVESTSSTKPIPIPFPKFEEPQTAPDSGSFHVDDSDFSSLAPTPNRPRSLNDEPRVVQVDSDFVPARLPHFNTQPD